MKVIIIGSNGLLADSIGKYCNRQFYTLEVIGLDKPLHHTCDKFTQIDLIHDAIDYEKLLDANVIFYAVGAGIQANLKESNQLIYTLNVSLPVQIFNSLESLNYQGVFVSFGSYFEIGDNRLNHRFTEEEIISSLLHVPNEYCISKRMLSRFLDSKSQKLRHLHVIFPTIYGENEATHRIIPYVIQSIRNKTMPQFTSGEQVRQYLYINDVPDILFKAVTKQLDGILNIAGTDCLTIKDLIISIYQHFGQEVPMQAFGSMDRKDVTMLNLQLDDTKLKTVIPHFIYTKLDDVINRY